MVASDRCHRCHGSRSYFPRLRSRLLQGEKKCRREGSNPRSSSQVITVLSVPGYQIPSNGLEGPNLYAFLFSMIGVGALVSIAIQVVSFETAGGSRDRSSSVSFFDIFSGARLTKLVRARTFAALLRQEAGFFDLEGNSMGALTSSLATGKTFKIQILILAGKFRKSPSSVHKTSRLNFRRNF